MHHGSQGGSEVTHSVELYRLLGKIVALSTCLRITGPQDIADDLAEVASEFKALIEGMDMEE
jgi:hypothetical protein